MTAFCVYLFYSQCFKSGVSGNIVIYSNGPRPPILTNADSRILVVICFNLLNNRLPLCVGGGVVNRNRL